MTRVCSRRFCLSCFHALSSFISSYRYLLSSVLSVYSSLPLPRPLCRSLENGCCRVSSAQNVWCGFCSLLFYLISAFGHPSRLRAQASPSGTILAFGHPFSPSGTYSKKKKIVFSFLFQALVNSPSLSAALRLTPRAYWLRPMSYG